MYVHFHVLRFAISIHIFLVQLGGTCFRTVINSSPFSLILFPLIYPDFPIMHNVMIQPSKLGTHLQPLNSFRSSCLRNRWAICPQSATSRSIFTLARVCYTQKFTVPCWRLRGNQPVLTNYSWPRDKDRSRTIDQRQRTIRYVWPFGSGFTKYHDNVENVLP